MGTGGKDTPITIVDPCGCAFHHSKMPCLVGKKLHQSMPVSDCKGLLRLARAVRGSGCAENVFY